MMTIEKFGIEGPILFTPKLINDDRGFFYESWNVNNFASSLGVEPAVAPVFQQDNHSQSKQGVLRGLHYQLLPEPQGKLVRCSAGAIFDVAVDVRRSSPTFGKWVGAELSADNHKQLWMPVGFAHGFLTLSESADVLYKASGLWNRSCERSLLWNDPAIGIEWPLDLLNGPPLLSDKDADAPMLEHAEVFA